MSENPKFLEHAAVLAAIRFTQAESTPIRSEADLATRWAAKDGLIEAVNELLSERAKR